MVSLWDTILTDHYPYGTLYVAYMLSLYGMMSVLSKLYMYGALFLQDSICRNTYPYGMILSWDNFLM